MPTVTKVVEIIKCPLSAQRLDQRFTGFRVYRRPPTIRVGHAVILTGNFKLMQMAITPAHHDLDDMVQFAQGDVFRHREPTPDRRSDPLQLNVQQQQVGGGFG
ncbi:hypothetical protein TU76_02405 [Pseudomonas psychrophila]|nr:hypothetical protein TU76_02405 [Pseudomonas psychrophila]